MSKAATKQLTAHDLRQFLDELEDAGNDLKKIVVNYRHDDDSEVEEVRCVWEDLFDSETNSVLESIILVTESNE